MKITYCGIDALAECLDVLEARDDVELVQIFTYSNDSYDETEKITAFSTAHNIPLQTTPITQEDIMHMELAGVEYMIVGGYAAKIPLSEKIRQINIHPSLLPMGRGPWPMPINILRNIPSGITLHKLSERFDEGDIILKKEIPLDENENLETLTERIKVEALSSLEHFFNMPEELWQNASKQVGGEYWEEPKDEDRTLLLESTMRQAGITVRAFYGYGVLYQTESYLMEIPYCEVVDSKEEAGDSILLPLADGYLQVKEWHPYFRKIRLSDRKKMELIRCKYPSRLSDYTFSLLFCWQSEMQLEIYLEDDFFVVRGCDYYFFPIGNTKRVFEFLDYILATESTVKLRFCDEDAAEQIRRHYGQSAKLLLNEDDSDYIYSIEHLKQLAGKKLHTKRKDIHHYEALTPPPEIIEIDDGNLHLAEEVAMSDAEKIIPAELAAIRNFHPLGIKGILMKRGEQVVGFALFTRQFPTTMQGQFCKCIDFERGGALYLIRACALYGEGEYKFINVEDDMGIKGIRFFKRSLQPQIIPSYTAFLSQDVSCQSEGAIK